MIRWPSDKLEREMLADATTLHKNASDDCSQDASCHIRALLSRVRELEDKLIRAEDCIMQFAWHAAGYRHDLSAAAVIAKVAEYCGVSVSDLNEQMAKAARGG